MLDHISIGVRDIERSRRFYDSVLAPLGYSRKMDVGATSGYGGDTPVYWIALAERPVPSDPKSGLHFCFAAPTRQSAAFAVDPDGYRLEAYCSRAV
jgi:catechol 2,3-dioxygenase-like lactoylglutathione lyase family enzyme